MRYYLGSFPLSVVTTGQLQSVSMPEDSQPISVECLSGNLSIQTLTPSGGNLRYVDRHFYVWMKRWQIEMDLPEKTMERDWDFTLLGSFISNGDEYNVAYLRE